MENLNQYKFSSREGFNSVLLKLRYKELEKFYHGKTCLELGSADGEGTKMLVSFFDRIVAVDGSEHAIMSAREYVNSDKVEFIHSYFEEFTSDERFDTVILAHILEHVDNPIEILKIGKRYLKPDGILIADVPNAKSLHRQIGVELGMIQSIYSLNESDLSIGHKRVYDLNTFKSDIESAGLQIVNEGGIFLKIFSNKELTGYSNEFINAFNIVGKNNYHIAAEIYYICSL